MGQQARILIVDDDRIYAEVTRQRLEDEDYAIQVMSSPTGVLTAIRRDAFDLLILDVQMPGISGAQLSSMIAARGGGQTKVLLHSSLDAPRLQEIAEKNGASDWIQKSASKAQLLEKVRRLTAVR